ncbi:hypothetical protein R3W88_026328 [Solanum pinnatisectum]|uniref:Allene oxide synthase n=1 Tax=Solanum pinnatisectum TaxID=50273 RepID=A0AAV9LD16_9SOLN|nr:hypothetical protein R3W88_026328 [Solanum pinnatisectum]
MKKYDTRVCRTNVPHGPFNARNSKVVVLVDVVSYPIIFYNSQVDKENYFDGTFMSSPSFNGGYKVCAFLDTTNSKHSVLKGLILSTLARLEKLGVKREEACHNFVFLAACRIQFIWRLHTRLVKEIRTAVKEAVGVTVVYETLRMDTPVPFQTVKAISNHEASFLIKKDELIFGYQPLATKDSNVFNNAEDFNPDRFVGYGEKLLKYVYWSNGKEIDNPTVDDKQCPGKDLIVLLGRLLVVEFFMRYDTFEIEFGKLLLGSKVTFKSIITKATS